MTADVAVVIVSYNTAGLLRKCLASLESERVDVDQQVIVVDNASVDGSADVVAAEFGGAELIRSDRNLGFAGGVNVGASAADARYILLLNPDTVILDHAVDEIVRFADGHRGHGLYGGRTLKVDGTLEPSSCWGRPTLWSLTCFATGLSTALRRRRMFDPESLGQWKRDSVREVAIVTGCFLLVDTDLWKQLDGLDERFFMYGEDADFAFRAASCGARPVIDPAATLVHEVGQASPRRIDKQLLLFTAKSTLARQLWSGERQWVALRLLVTGVALRAALTSVVRRLRPDAEDSWEILWKRRSEWVPGY
jgi:hypothetical protein